MRHTLNFSFFRRPSVHPFVRRLSGRACICPSVRPSVRSSVRPFVRSSVHSSVRPFVRLFGSKYTDGTVAEERHNNVIALSEVGLN